MAHAFDRAATSVGGRVTIGIFADTRSARGRALLAEATQRFQSRDFLAALQLLRESDRRYFVAAGHLDRKAGGCILVLTMDEEAARLAAMIANDRVSQGGSTATAWTIGCESDLERRIQAALRGEQQGQYSCFNGGLERV